MVQGLVSELLLQRQFLATGFLGRHEDLDLGQRQRQAAQILHPSAPRGPGSGRRVGHRLLMDATALSVTQEEEDEQGMHEQDMFDGVVLVLATLTVRLCSRVVGADDAPFGPVMGKRGEAGAAAGAAATGADASSSRDFFAGVYCTV